MLSNLPGQRMESGLVSSIRRLARSSCWPLSHSEFCQVADWKDSRKENIQGNILFLKEVLDMGNEFRKTFEAALKGILTRPYFKRSLEATMSSIVDNGNCSPET